MKCSHFHWKHKGMILPEMWFAAGNLLTKSTKCVQTRDSFGGKNQKCNLRAQTSVEKPFPKFRKAPPANPTRAASRGKGREQVKSSQVDTGATSTGWASSPALNFLVFMEKPGCGSTALGLPAEQPRRVRLVPVKTFQNYRHKARPDQNKLKRSRQGLVTS